MARTFCHKIIRSGTPSLPSWPNMSPRRCSLRQLRVGARPCRRSVVTIIPVRQPNEPEWVEGMLAHSHNVREKRRFLGLGTAAEQALGDWAGFAFLTFLGALDFTLIAEGDLTSATAALNVYSDAAKDAERQSVEFNWRSNYAGSIIPQFIYRGVHTRLAY